MRLWVSLLVFVIGASLYPQTMPDVRSMLADVFPVSQLKPGMKGYGLTVFKGTKIERFEVEVIGVLEQANWGRPLVMVKMKGGPITERNAMVIAGMSGSPIYINNKILGAIAYGFAFPREPVGLVTPLEDMLTEFDPKVAREVRMWTESRTIAQPIRLGGQQYAGVHIGLEKPSAPNLAWARPLMTPVMVSGVSHRTMERLKLRLERFGLTPVMAPAGGSQRPLPVQFEPGAALGGSIITGDMDFTAIGTLTYRKGDYVLGFGHPFFGMGKIEMPMTAAEIVDVFASYAASFKLGNRAQTLGTIYQDGAFAIAGRMRQNCSMMPIRMRVTNTETGISRSFSCEIIRHPLILASFADIPIVEFLDRVHFAMGHAGALVRWSLATQPYGVIRYENRVASSTSILGEVSNDLLYVMNLLLNAPEGEVRLESLDVEVVITPGRATAFVESAQVDKPAYRPGERVQITAMVRPPDASAPRSYTLSLRLPYDLMPGSYRLQVGAPAGQGGAPSLPGLMGVVLIGDIGGGGGTASTEQALREFQLRERNHQLVATLTLRTPTVSVRGMPLHQPPPLLRSVLAQPRSSELMQDADQLKQIVDTEWVLEGSHVIMLTVLPPEARDDRRSAFVAGFAGEGFGEEPPMGVATEEAEVMPEQEESLEYRSDTTTETDGTPAEPEVRGESSKPKKEKPVSRKPQQWRPNTFAQLQRGTMEGVALGADGQLRLSPQLTRLAQLTGDYLWCAVGLPDGSFAVGAGGRGEILRIDKQARQATRTKLEGTLVTAITTSDVNTLYAGTSPEGVVYRVQGERAEAVVNTQARYVNALLWHENTLYIATGVPARLLAWDGRSVRILLTTDESHFSALALDANRNLYVGTSEKGIVYRVSPDGAVSAIADLQEPSVTALLCTEDSTLYIGTMPSGNLYRLTASGELQSLHTQGKLSVHALSRQGNQLIALARDGVYRVDLTAERPTVEMVARAERALISGVASEDRVYLFSAEGEGWQLAGHSQEGSYTSPVLDARQQARWGTLQVGATIPEGTEVLVQTRSGNTREPDASWSGWTAPAPIGESITVLSPPARFLQVRFLLKGKEARSPVVHQFSISYLPANRPPEVRLQSPKPYAVLSGKQTLRWSARDPDGDTLRFEAQLSQDGGITWNAIKDGKPSTKAQSAPSDKPERAGKSDQQILSEMLAELESNPEIPESVKEQIKRDAPQLVAQMRQAQAQSVTPSEPSQPSETVPSSPNRQEWDTTQVPDGVYLLRLMATDQPSMPTDYATVYTPPIPIAVCNTPPALVIHERRTTVQAEGRVVLEGFALQRRLAPKSDGSQVSSQQEQTKPLFSVPITAVQYKVGNGEWVSAEPIDGMFDSGFEPFRIRIENLPAGEHTITILAFNAGGKTTQIEQKITVPKRE